MTRWAWSRDRPAGDPNPFECYLLVACLITGIAVLLRFTAPRSIDELLPPWLRFVWGLLLALGGGAALAGLYWPGDPFTGIEIKRVGLLAAAVGTAAYGSAVAFHGSAGLAVALSNLLFAVACIVRILQVTRRIRSARQYLVGVRRHDWWGKRDGDHQ